MLLLTLFLTVTVFARGRGRHGCTQEDLEIQNSDLRCLLQPFTGVNADCGDSPTSTTCALRVHQDWPHEGAVSSDVNLRRLLGGRGRGRTNTARFEVASTEVTEVVVRSGRRNNPTYECMGTDHTLEITNVETHEYVADSDADVDTEEDDESDSPYAVITFTQTNTDADGNVVTFDLTSVCRVAYRPNDADECTVRGLKCHEGEYTYNVEGEEAESTVEETENFRMHCVDSTVLETYPHNWDTTLTCDNQ